MDLRMRTCSASHCKRVAPAGACARAVRSRAEGAAAERAPRRGRRRAPGQHQFHLGRELLLLQHLVELQERRSFRSSAELDSPPAASSASAGSAAAAADTPEVTEGLAQSYQEKLLADTLSPLAASPSSKRRVPPTVQTPARHPIRRCSSHCARQRQRRSGEREATEQHQFSQGRGEARQAERNGVVQDRRKD